MKKCLFQVTTAILSVACSFSANSFETVNVETGVDYWWSSNRINDDRRDSDDTSSFFISAEHEHEYLPDIKFRYSTLDADSVALDKYDATLYYKVLERDALQLDLGVTLSQYTNTQYIDDSSREYDFDEWTLSFYADGTIHVPDTSLDLISQFDFSDRDGKKTADVLVGMEYGFDISSIAPYSVSLRAGYRVMDYTFSEIGTSDPVEILIDGWFLGGKVAF